MRDEEVVKTIAESNYGLWSIIAQTAISQNRTEVFIGLMKDFITQNYSGAINVFGKEIVNYVVKK